MDNYQQVISVEVDGVVTKTPAHLVFGYNRFSVPVIYTLWDGRKISGTVSSRLKRDVLGSVERDDRKARMGDVKLKVSDHDETQAGIVSISYSLRGDDYGSIHLA